MLLLLLLTGSWHSSPFQNQTAQDSIRQPRTAPDNCRQLHMAKTRCRQLHMAKNRCRQPHMAKNRCRRLHMARNCCRRLHMATYTCDVHTAYKALQQLPKPSSSQTNASKHSQAAFSSPLSSTAYAGLRVSGRVSWPIAACPPRLSSMDRLCCMSRQKIGDSLNIQIVSAFHHRQH